MDRIAKALEFLGAVEELLMAEMAPEPTGDGLTLRTCLEIVEHEGIVLEAYKDSVGVWTWGIGVTSKSGHRVERYKDNPQSIQRCVEIFIWLLKNDYAPDVRKAFEPMELSEHQFAAALSFHYNTGAIHQADWVDSAKRGDDRRARVDFMNWRKPASIIRRREKERNLFFDGTWSQDGMATVWPVRKPSYRPDWPKAIEVDIREPIKALIGASS